MYKLKFDKEAIVSVMPVESYSTYNGIYTSKEFTRDLHVKGQVIKHSEVVGNHHNGVA